MTCSPRLQTGALKARPNMSRWLCARQAYWQSFSTIDERCVSCGVNNKEYERGANE